MSTIYQDAVAGKIPTMEQTLARRQREEKDLANIKESWAEWLRDPKTQVFINRLKELQYQKEEILDTKLMAAEISRVDATLLAMEVATIRNVIRLINTGNYNSVGNILYK